MDSGASIRLLHNSIEGFLQKRERDFVKTTNNTLLLEKLCNREVTKEQLGELVGRSYAIFLYERDGAGNDSLRFWNDQRSLPTSAILNGPDSSGFIHLSNGQYESIKRTLPGQSGKTIVAIALIPVRYQYFITNINLLPEFAGYPSAENKVRIVPGPSGYPVHSINGQVLFYLEKKPGYNAATSNPLLLVMALIGVLLLLVVIHNVAHAITMRFGSVVGIVFLVVVILFLRGLIYAFPSLLNLRQYRLFDPTIYSASYILRSLGDLLINSFLLCWVALFIRREIGEYMIPVSEKRWKNWVGIVFVLAILVLLTLVFANTVQTLVLDSKISFNVTNFFSILNINSFIGFIVLASMALGYFFLSQVLFRLITLLIRQLSIVLYILIATMGLLAVTFMTSTKVVELDIFVLLWLLAYVWLIQRKIFSDLHFRLNVSEVLFWLFIFSASISAVIIFENRKIELEQRKRRAETLSELADPSSVKVLSIVLSYIDNDFLAPNFQRFRDSASNAIIKDSLINTNFTAYQDKFDSKIYTYDGNERPLFNKDPISYDTLNTIFKVQGKITGIQDLRYIEKAYDRFSYIFRKVVTDGSQKVLGYVFVLSEPKSYKSDALIPELFTQKKEYLPEYSPIYSYALYNKRELIEHYSDYQFPTNLSEDQIPKTDFIQIKNGSYDELWHRVTNDSIVVIVKKDNDAIEALTLFSYLFSAFLFLVALFRMTALLIWSRLHWSQLKTFWQLNIRSQIHTSIIFISLFSFAVILVATIIFFYNRYNRNNRDRLGRAIQIMANEVENKLASHGGFDPVKLYDPSSREVLEGLVDGIAEIHGMDVNLYDLDGNLQVSSNPLVYNKGILSEKMHPLAFYNLSELRSVHYTNEEKIGDVSYLSVYCPVRDVNGNAYAYLNIPSFTTQDELKEEISNFLVTIIILNAFIFLIAGTIALFLTNGITSSFTLISEKMQQVNLGKTNEVIEWKRNDEIGGLVKEYNKMVRKLEDSAVVLAKSEREGAWREMARQVAHEIKNPLTPMKLSIQYLQKAIDNNSQNVKEMAAGVARTLVEQIDHLSKIASDFSQFANIGNPKKEVFDLHELLYSLTSLYETTENLLFKWVPVHQRLMIYADKTQLNRLFTNLLQNAVEACDGNEGRRVISVSEELREESILVKVSDNGEGIPVEMRSKIFIPNFTTKSSGTGLGLAMSKTIVEQAKGNIWFETVEGVGTTFFVELPVLRATA